MELTAKDNWTYTWDELQVLKNGKKITYTVEQAYVPNNGTDNEYTYVSTVADAVRADFVITNRFRPVIDKDITIIWDDINNEDNTRPDEVLVQPTVDGEKYGDPIKITVEDVKDDDNNTWKGNTSKLPKYTEDGEEIVYRVVQSDVDKYTTSYSDDSFTITNKYTRLPLQPEEEDETVEEDKKHDNKDESETEVEEDNNYSPNKGKDTVVKDKNNGKDTSKKNDKTPKTGDAYDMSKYVWMLMLSAMGLLFMYENKKRRA